MASRFGDDEALGLDRRPAAAVRESDEAVHTDGPTRAPSPSASPSASWVSGVVLDVDCGFPTG
jgi:hypothetical protein